MPSPRRIFLASSGVGALAGLLPRPGIAAETSSLALTPQVTEGPFYLDVGLVRADIAEGLKGVPLDVRIRVVDVADRPLEGFRVDVWHCDAAGLYSGFDGQDPGRGTTRGRTFLRGTLAADREGFAVFRTVYPGWYAGRTTHLHFKVFKGRREVLTSQLFLPDALSEYLYTNLPTYRRAALRDTLNRGDGIALEAGAAAFGSVREEADRYVVSATAVVDPQARPVVQPPGGPDARRPERPDAAGGVRPRFDVGNRGGGVHGAIGIGGPLGAAGRDGPGRPGDRPLPDSGGPPFDDGRSRTILSGDARVAAIVPGITVP